jgi:hypothetical protein
MADVMIKAKAAEDTRGSRVLVKGPGRKDFHYKGSPETDDGKKPDVTAAEAKYADKFDEPTYYG